MSGRHELGQCRPAEQGMVWTLEVHDLELEVSIRLFSLLPNKTSTQTVPMGAQETPGTIPWKVVRLGCSMFSVMPIDDGIDESVLLPQLRQQILLIP